MFERLHIIFTLSVIIEQFKNIILPLLAVLGFEFSISHPCTLYIQIFLVAVKLTLKRKIAKFCSDFTNFEKVKKLKKKLSMYRRTFLFFVVKWSVDFLTKNPPNMPKCL